MTAELHDRQAEAAVLTAALYGIPGSIEALLDLEPSDVADTGHAQILDAMRAHFRQGKPVELPALGGTLRERGHDRLIVRLAELADEFVPGDTSRVQFYVNRVRELAHLRRVDRVARRLPAVLVDPELQYAERLEQFASQVFTALETREQRALGTAEALADQVIELSHDRASARERGEPKTTISSGFPDLDNRTGGLCPGRLVVLGARSGFGKSTWCQDVALHAARTGHSVLIAGLESTPLEIFLSLLWKETGIRPVEAREGLVDEDRLAEGLGGIRGLPLVIESGRFKLADLVTLVRRTKLVHHTEFVLVDYVQLIANRLRGQTRATELAGVTAALKQLAIELEICILAAAQLNKGPEEREGAPQLRDIRESEAIAHDADQVIFLSRPDLRGGDSEPFLTLRKNRHGRESRKILLVYEAEFNRYRPKRLRAAA